MEREQQPLTLRKVEDAGRTDVETAKAFEDGEEVVCTDQDTHLKHMIMELQTQAHQGIFRLKSRIVNLVRVCMENEGFLKIQTPLLFEGTLEGRADVFLSVDYGGQPAFFASSAQLSNQMAIGGDLKRVYAVGPVFRADTHGHMCEVTGLDVEMEIYGSYFEVMDVVDRLFVGIFDGINERCQRELEAIGKQYPFKPLKYLRKTLRLTFEQGVQMLKDAGFEVDPLGDLNTESERRLGKLVLDKYGTEFYMLHRYPLAVRPFYTMPCPDNEAYSNSFDVFLRGEEIISGGQRVHVLELLESRATQCGIDVKTMPTYMDLFRYGALPPHGGFGVGLEQLVTLLLSLDDIHKTSFFPFGT